MELRPARIEDVPVPVPELRPRRVVAVELPLDPGSRQAEVADRWDLKVPERSGQPEGKPEGLVVTADGTFIVGLDTRTPDANLCWYPR